MHDLAIPATTDAAKLAAKASDPAPDSMTVVFSTYQSIQVVSDAQNQHGLPEFDLIICDEAHRTTGATLAGEEESNFVRVHDAAIHQGQEAPLHDGHAAHIRRCCQEQGRRGVGAGCARWTTRALYGETLFHSRLRLGGRRTAC